jgi:hypothetical protein
MRQHAKVWQEKVDMNRKENEWCLGQEQSLWQSEKRQTYLCI